MQLLKITGFAQCADEGVKERERAMAANPGNKVLGIGREECGC